MCVLVTKGNLLNFLFYFTAASVKCHMAAVISLLLLHHSADYINFLCDHSAHSGYGKCPKISNTLFHTILA